MVRIMYRLCIWLVILIFTVSFMLCVTWMKQIDSIRYGTATIITADERSKQVTPGFVVEESQNVHRRNSTTPTTSSTSTTSTTPTTPIASTASSDIPVDTTSKMNVPTVTHAMDVGMEAAHTKLQDLARLKAARFPALDSDVIRIILWNSGTDWGWNDWKGPIQEESYLTKRDCSYNNCIITQQADKLEESDFILLPPALFNHSIQLPTERFPWQSYIVQMSERPGPWNEYYWNWDPHVNLTMSYRIDSDIYYDNRGFQPHRHPPPEGYQVRIPLATKHKTAVWMVSNCAAESKRDAYAMELAKHLDVDIYGKCGDKYCEKGMLNTFACYEHFEKTYKFYLAFENSLCADYVTEKAYKPMGYEIIPVVFGGGNYSRKLPPHSFINTMDYDSPRELAKYLKYLATNENEYHAYFEWKAYYEPQKSPKGILDRFCALCTKLNDPMVATKNVTGFAGWWQGSCDNSYVDEQRTKSGW